MLGRLFQILLCFLITMQPPSKSLFTDIYYRIAESGPTVLITIVDNAAAELVNVARNVDSLSEGLLSSNYSDTHKEYDKNIHLRSIDLNNSELKQENESSQLQDHLIINENVTETVDESVIDPISDDFKFSNISDDKSAGENDTIEVEKVEIETKAQEDIPSFSEWAQKQLEEAEKNKEAIVNDSAKSMHKTQFSNVNLKVSSKNYASPDCGAKIVAANPESGSSSFILSPSRDEYMLNTCNSRIWFIVELCEAIQAKKIDLANFELFSSTPKNFSVYVSDRFPTREWAGVGQFIAKDERDIQTFNLHPHLFGKFIKVELHSHYGSEHYCPISLFRVYGTSEFEVFETENSPQSQTNQDNDNDDDDVIEGLSELEENGDVSKNLFGSARDAVMSIVKKAAEVLVKNSDSRNSSVHLENVATITENCKTPSHIVVCDNCSNSLFKEVYDLMSCKSEYLEEFVELRLIRSTLCNSDLCQSYGLDFKSKKTSVYKTELASYISAILMPNYVAALCNMLAIMEKKVVLNVSFETEMNVTSNLTIDKKAQAAANEGLIDDLLNKPFGTRISDDCSNDKDSNVINKLNEIPDKSLQLEIQNTTPPEINPTKTLSGSDSMESNIKTTDVIIDSSSNTPSMHTNEHNLGSNIESSEVNKINEQYEDVKSIDVNKNNIKEEVSENTTILKENDVIISNITNIEVDNSNFTIEDSNSQEYLKVWDTILNEFEQGGHSTPAPAHNVVTTPHQAQKESVFLRLSNRIKALEKNMSLSGQYLEELSRRYKKQVEDMKKTFEKTLLTLSEESKRSEERDQKNSDELLVLQQQIAQLSTSVNILLAERESWLGSLTFFKVIVFQILITLTVIYLCRKNNTNEHSLINDRSITVDVATDRNKLRRISAEEMRTMSSDIKLLVMKRRASEEDLSRLSASINNAKTDKKKRKKKTLVQRSVSMVGGTGLSNVDPKIKVEIDNIELPVALEEPEFIMPEVEPIDFNKMGECKEEPKELEITPKREFPKTNGSIIGIKSILNNKKPVKVRRLSSPAFFKTVNKQWINNSDSSVSIEQNSPVIVTPSLSHKDYGVRDFKSEERDLKSEAELFKGNDWSSASELSQTSTSTTATTNCRQKEKKSSFKKMLKKVF